MMRYLLCYLFMLFIVSPAIAANTLTATDVLASARLHSPKILAAKEEEAIAAANILEARGSFDPSIKQDAISRIDGYYDGQQLDTRLEQPFAPFNSTFFTGYRVAEGSFPVYEDELITAEDGEWMIGMRLSLLRNRSIDPRRLALSNAELAYNAAEAAILQARLNVQEEALLYYWDWVAAGLTYKVYQELLNIATTRQDAFERKVAQGDLPRIYLTENRQYILQREANVNNALRVLLQAGNKLSLYYRDSEGKPLVPDKDQLPNAFMSDMSAEPPSSVDDWLEQRPELRAIAAEIRQLDNTIDYGTNLRLPAADLEVKHANDYGAGTPQRTEAETIVKLNVSIPLRQRKADGITQQAIGKKRQLEHKHRQLLEQLTMELDNVFVTLETAEEYIALTREEIELARTMQQAEQTRIESGDSDYFLLIMRDENLAKARIKHISAQSLYQQAQVRIHALTMNINAL